MARSPFDTPAIRALADHQVLEMLAQAARSERAAPEVLFELGDLLTRQGRLREGLEVDLRLTRLLPREPTVHYNLACSHSLLGDREAAFRALEEAIRLGYRDADHMRRDRDLDPIRDDPRFADCLRRIGR